MEGEIQNEIRPQDSYNQGQYRGYNKGRGRGGYYKKNYYNKNNNETADQNPIESVYTNQNYSKKPLDKEESTEKVDPYTAQMLIYRAEMYILLRYPYLIDLNTKNESIVKTVDERSQFFVIKSFSEEDVHKAIKYNVWTSTKSGNQTLNTAFKVTKEKGGHVYLFFSCNGSGRFVGLARMKNEVETDKFFPYWTQDNKWCGLFDIEWVFVKDVPFREFTNIIVMMKDGQRKPVSNSRDTQEIPAQEGKSMVETIHTYLNTNTILEHFEYYDMRQENYERNHPIQSQTVPMSY